MQDEKLERIAAALRRWGAKLGRWPDGAMAAEARMALMSDRSLRAACEEEKRLDAALAAHGAAIDAALTAEGARERVAAGVLGRISRRQPLDLGRLAAAVLVAGFLGGAVDALFLPQREAPQIVLADQLVYGPDSVEFR